MRRSAILLFAALALSGCGKAFYDYGAEALRKDPKVKAQALKDCIKDTERKPLYERQLLASATRVSLARMPRVFCGRIIAGVASGRITYADIQEGSGDKVLHVMQGR